MASLGAVAMFSFLLLAGAVVKDMLDLLAEGHLTIPVFLRLIQLRFPELLIYALPLGLLTGVLLSMGRLSAQSEITALRSAGVSIFRLSSSVIVFSVLAALLSLMVNFYYGPRAMAAFRSEREAIIQKNPLSFIQEKTFVRGFSGLVIYVGEKNGDELEDLWVWELDDENRAKSILRAESGEIRYNQDENTLILVPYRGTVEGRDPNFPEDSRKVATMSFESTSILLPLDSIFGKVTFQKKLKWMTFKELQEVEAEALAQMTSPDAELRAAGTERYHKAKMAFHEKFAMGFSVIAFAMIGVPMGIQASRKETSANLFLAIGLALGYYVLMMGISWMDGMHKYRPDLLFWIPNFLYQGIGCWMFFKADRGRKLKTDSAALAAATA